MDVRSCSVVWDGLQGGMVVMGYFCMCGACVEVSGWAFECLFSLRCHDSESLLNSANECIECCCSATGSSKAPCLST